MTFWLATNVHDLITRRLVRLELTGQRLWGFSSVSDGSREDYGGGGMRDGYSFIVAWMEFVWLGLTWHRQASSHS